MVDLEYHIDDTASVPIDVYFVAKLPTGLCAAEQPRSIFFYLTPSNALISNLKNDAFFSSSTPWSICSTIYTIDDIALVPIYLYTRCLGLLGGCRSLWLFSVV